MPSTQPDSKQREIESEIERVLRETEASTLALGDNLGRILQDSQEFTAQLQRSIGALGGEGDKSVAAVLASQDRTVTDFLEVLRRTVAAQSAIAERVLDTSRVVAQAAQSVASISMQSRMLSLNTMIEAERLGSQGRPVMVIAQEMRELSENIAGSNQEITRLAVALAPLLDEVKHNIGSLNERTDDFGRRFDVERERIREATANVENTVRETLRTGDERLESIVELSNRSLVALQSQDIVSQRLRRVISLNAGETPAGPARAMLDTARSGGPTAAELISRGEATDGFLSETLNASAGAKGLDAGEMMMF